MNTSILLMTCVVCFSMAFTVISQDSKSFIYRSFFFTAILTAAWAIVSVIFMHTDNIVELEAISRTSVVIAAILPLSLIYLAANFPQKPAKQPYLLYTFYGLIGLVLVISANIIISEFPPLIGEFSNLSRPKSVEFFLAVFAGYFEIGIIISAILNIKNLYKYNDKINKNKVGSTLKALTILSVIMSVSFNFITVAVFNNYNFIVYGIVSIVLLLITYVVGFWKFGFYDYYPAVLNTIAYLLTEITIVGFYFLVRISTYNTSGGRNLSFVTGIFLIAFLALVFQPILNFFTGLMNRFLDKRDGVDRFMSQLSTSLVQTTDLEKLLKKLSYNIAGAIGAKDVLIYAKYGADREKELLVSHKKSRKIPQEDIETLTRYATNNNSKIITIATLFGDDEYLGRLFRSHRWSMVMPLKTDDEIIGFIIAKAPVKYNFRSVDINLLFKSYDSLMLAINSAVAIQSAREVNDNLAQRIKSATKDLRKANLHLQKIDEGKDEFISMASHQLRTPLTSVKGYISMILDGDTGEINDMQKHFLEESFESSERMVHIINDFLNVSRLQTGKFILDKTNGNFVEVVEKEVHGLENAAKARNLTLNFNSDSDSIQMRVDFGKLSQIIMNLIDNAIYYSKPGGVVNVSINQTKDKVEFMVEDSGIGVPESEQSGLFTKFYRATNARKQRPDGTGVGLYLAKKVALAHKGDVVFKDNKGKGSTFGFWLPKK